MVIKTKNNKQAKMKNEKMNFASDDRRRKVGEWGSSERVVGEY